MQAHLSPPPPRPQADLTLKPVPPGVTAPPLLGPEQGASQASAALCPSRQSPAAQMQPQESSVQYSRWEDGGSRDGVSVASRPGAEEASGWAR